MDDLGKILNRPKEYQNIDGVEELGMSFFTLSCSLLLWVQTHTPRTSFWHTFYPMILLGFVMPFVNYLGGKAIKNHITYRRTGYIEYRGKRKRWVVLAISFGIAILISGGLGMAIRHHFSMSTSFSLFGLVIAAIYIPFALKVQWKWIVFLAMLGGTLTIAALPADLLDSAANHSHFGSALSSQALGAFWLIWTVNGVLFLTSGIVTFCLYLRHTQAAVGENR